MVLMLLRIKYVCSGHSEVMSVFMAFNLWIGSGFIFEPGS
jgi:hypothetical protein